MVAYDGHAMYFAKSRKSGSLACGKGERSCSGPGGATMEVLKVKTARRTQLVDVTDQVERAAQKAGVSSGVCYVYVPHTTAGVILNEHFDQDVASDLEGVFDRLVPKSASYQHSEGNSDSHAKAALTASSQMIFLEDGKLALGRWQGVFFCEFDGPRERKMWVKVVGNPS
jgi:secondary thiamine-phosphate synthase enzyme